MGQIKVTKCPIEGLYIIEPAVHGDSRGYFMETYSTKAMADIGVERCVYIGDSEVDLLTAKNAGVPCLTVLWGFRDRPQLEKNGAVYFCDAVAQLPEMIEKIIGEVYGQ